MSNKIQFFVNISVGYGHMKYTRRTKRFMHESATQNNTSIPCKKVKKFGNRIPSFAENGGVVSIDLYIVQL